MTVLIQMYQSLGRAVVGLASLASSPDGSTPQRADILVGGPEIIDGTSSHSEF